MALLWWTLGLLVAAVVLIVLQGMYLGAVLKWEDQETVGLGYYGRSLAERNRFKRKLRLHALLLTPILRLGSLNKLDLRKAGFQYKGVGGPSWTCSPESFEKAEGYQPRPGDIFVVTQMKCGTTWMQHVVYELLHRGGGTLVASGTAMYAVAPWLEGRKGVPLDQAPMLGAERPSRIIKTHFPAQLCPVSAEARYIYVARHPVSCFASCVDFITTNVGSMAPGVEAFEEWYKSPELMWWGTWPAHVRGWWERAARDKNVLFLYFEDMKRDLPAVVRKVAEFLDVAPLNQQELTQVVEKCSFAYMQEHQDNFEMHPPHILQTNAALFVAGTADRHKDVPADVRQRILAWSAGEMAGSTLPLAKVYPDVVASPS